MRNFFDRLRWRGVACRPNVSKRNDGAPGRGTVGAAPRRRNRHAEAATVAREARQAHRQSLVFSARHFVGFGLPVKRAPSDQTEHTVSDGGGSLTVLGSSAHGLPFGQDRLFIVWLASAFFAAGKPKDNTIRFDSVGCILQAFKQGYHRSGTEYAILRERILRLFHCSFIWRLPEPGGKIRRIRGKLMRSIDLCFFDNDVAFGKWSQRIQLDTAWADDLRAGETVPYDLESLTALRRNPVALDLYLWQAWRSWRLSRKALGWMRKPIEVPIFGDDGLLAQFGYQFARPRKAKEVLRRAQRLVASVWHDCPNRLDHSGEKFLVGPGEALKRQSIADATHVKLPGVEPATAAVLEREQAARSKRPSQVLSLHQADKPKA